jgi:hypothetical protein
MESSTKSGGHTTWFPTLFACSGGNVIQNCDQEDPHGEAEGAVSLPRTPDFVLLSSITRLSQRT